jgi:vacuolar-type H+-ATPase subunit E/Vma4
MGGGELEIIVRKEDEKSILKSLKNIESDVKKITGEKTTIKISTQKISPGVIVRNIESGVKKITGEKTTIKISTQKISPGVIVRRGDGKVEIDSTFQGDGKVEIDSTFQTRLELLRSELRLKVAGELFQ